MDRAYAVLETKALGGRRFAGIASTPTPDRDGHVIDLAGVTFRNPVPLLLQHDQRTPIGQAWLTKTADAITFEAEIAELLEPGPLKTAADSASQAVGAGLMRAVSIGFRLLKDGLERLSSGLLRMKAIEICELSLVTIPANVDATILSIKSYAAAPGPKPSLGVSSIPGLSAMTITEQISSWEGKRTTTAAAMAALMTKAADAGEALAGDDATKYDAYGAEIVSIDEQLERLRVLEKINKAAALPITRPGAPTVVSLKPKAAPGLELAMVAMCLGRARGDKMLAIEYAKEFKDSPNVELFLKAAVAPGTTTDPAWAGALVPSVAPVGNDFLDLLRPKTIIGRIPGLLRVPFNTYLPRVTDGGSVGWVGEGARKKVTKQAFDKVQIGEAKAAAIVVLTDELVKRSQPAAIGLVQQIMIDTMVAFLDGQFIDPAVAAVAGVHPASITNGIAPIVSAGKPEDDIAALLGAFAAANIPLSSVAVIMSDSNALALSLRRSATGVPLYPNMSVSGGTLPGGLSVVTSNTAGTNIVALAPQLVMFADEGILLDVSREASVEMSDAPDGTGGLVSLWQSNMVGLRVERYINWQRARTEAVHFVSGAAYVPTPGA